MKTLLTVFALLTIHVLFSQDSTQASSPVQIGGYVEAYYGYDFAKPINGSRPAFLYSHNRHNEFNVNLALLKANYAKDRTRANLALAVGTYMNANYAAEPGLLQHIYEANVGYQLARKKNFWFDIGILPSHIGFESAIAKDDWALTRSLAAENSPYYESGARITYGSDDGKFSISGLALNGWQRITRVAGNSKLSWGVQVTYKPTQQLTINYSNFLGTDKPDSTRLNRTFHDFYAIYQPTGKWGITLGFDYGTEDRQVNGKGTNKWYTPVAIIRYLPADKWAIALRAESYHDANNVIITTGTGEAVKLTGLSANIDYAPGSNALFRVEWRRLSNSSPIFEKDNGSIEKANTALTFSAAISF